MLQQLSPVGSSDKSAVYATTLPHLLPLSHHSGTWKFFLASGVAKAPKGFEDPEFMDKSWDNINVPGHWQLQDAGNSDPPIYTNTNYPFPNHPPYAPKKNPTGLYRRSFALPAEWLVPDSRDRESGVSDKPGGNFSRMW